MKRIAQVTLDIVYDPELVDHPSEWDWSTLLDTTPEFTVSMVSYRMPRYDPLADNVPKPEVENG